MSQIPDAAPHFSGGKMDSFQKVYFQEGWKKQNCGVLWGTSWCLSQEILKRSWVKMVLGFLGLWCSEPSPSNVWTALISTF